MNNLKAKLKKEGGFTLIEMLIVVAIIAILVAISIPLVNQALERARESTDAANERSFKAVLTISYLNGKFEMTNGTTPSFNVDTKYYYDAANGTLATDVPDGYGKSTTVDVVDGLNRKGSYLVGAMGNDGVVYMRWAEVEASGTVTDPGAFTAPTATSAGSFAGGVDTIYNDMVSEV